MKIRPLKNVGVEICDLDLSSLSKTDYQEIAEVFFSELMVLFRATNTAVLPFAKLVASFGEIVNKGQCIWNKSGDRVEPVKGLDPFRWTGEDESFPVQRVTGKKIGGAPTGIFGTGILDWHCNINGVTWAPGVGLQAIAGVEGTQTSWMDTTRAYDDLSEELKRRCEDVIGHFSYSPAVWAEGLPEWQLNGMLAGSKPGGYRMKLVNTSERGKKGLYFHFLNDCRFPTDPELLDILKRHCFQEKYIQTIDWRPGDIHISHQILTLHRREQSDPGILAERVLHRYTFDFSKYYPDQKPLYL